MMCLRFYVLLLYLWKKSRSKCSTKSTLYSESTLRLETGLNVQGNFPLNIESNLNRVYLRSTVSDHFTLLKSIATVALVFLSRKCSTCLNFDFLLTSFDVDHLSARSFWLLSVVQHLVEMSLISCLWGLILVKSCSFSLDFKPFFL